jgi:hypothetical protein
MAVSSTVAVFHILLGLPFIAMTFTNAPVELMPIHMVIRICARGKMSRSILSLVEQR